MSIYIKGELYSSNDIEKVYERLDLMIPVLEKEFPITKKKYHVWRHYQVDDPMYENHQLMGYSKHVTTVLGFIKECIFEDLESSVPLKVLYSIVHVKGDSNDESKIGDREITTILYICKVVTGENKCVIFDGIV